MLAMYAYGSKNILAERTAGSKTPKWVIAWYVQKLAWELWFLDRKITKLTHKLI